MKLLATLTIALVFTTLLFSVKTLHNAQVAMREPITVQTLPERRFTTTTGDITFYVCTSEPCINAAGKRPREGYSVACPRKYPLGTEVVIFGADLVCDDRLNIRMPEDRWDIYVDSASVIPRDGIIKNVIIKIYEIPQPSP